LLTKRYGCGSGASNAHIRAVKVFVAGNVDGASLQAGGNEKEKCSSGNRSIRLRARILPLPPSRGEALIIDPVIEKVDRYLQFVRELDLKLVKAVDTHLHADHITGLGALRDRTQASP
jgi:glyoxylase-like metal-dependent hydrolase (beta-lactamase superfamily II)